MYLQKHKATFVIYMQNQRSFRNTDIRPKVWGHIKSGIFLFKWLFSFKINKIFKWNRWL